MKSSLFAENSNICTVGYLDVDWSPASRFKRSIDSTSKQNPEAVDKKRSVNSAYTPNSSTGDFLGFSNSSSKTRDAGEPLKCLHYRYQIQEKLAIPKSTKVFCDLEIELVQSAILDTTSSRPYKSLSRGHIDFVREECVALLEVLNGLDHLPRRQYDDDLFQLRSDLRARLRNFTEDNITAIIQDSHNHSGSPLLRRKRKDIRAFLLDLINSSTPLHHEPRLTKVCMVTSDDGQGEDTSLGSLLRNRELGCTTRAVGRNTRMLSNPRSQLEARIEVDMKPWRSWKGASNDVVMVAWAPDSLTYAAGAAAHTDDHDLQYNRHCNLMYGHVLSNTIQELPDHRVARPKPETISSGPNSNSTMYRACDPVIYKTVSAVQFSSGGDFLYTTSHDKTAKVWTNSVGEKPACIQTLYHDAEVTGLEVSNHYPLFATASRTTENAIRVYQHGSEQGYHYTGFTSPRAVKHPEQRILPECVRWGLTPHTKHLLLAGFQQWTDYDYSATRQGNICLWDINTQEAFRISPHASSVFTAAWHPTANYFATGGAPGGGDLSNRDTKSVVRIYDVCRSNSYEVEFECPALDMHDVTFHPTDSNYVTAASTDGSTYVWDYRWADNVLHRLPHGEPLLELPSNDEGLPYTQHRERVDAGVLLNLWSRGASTFYTGSSDGVIKAWDIMRSPEDVWIKDVASLPAGIQSGALSPDGMSMLVGDASGGIHILSAAPFEPHQWSDNLEDDSGEALPIKYIPAVKEDGDDPGTEGIDEAERLLGSQSVVIHERFGAGKGPSYYGPLASHARWHNTTSGYLELLPEYERSQAFSINGEERQEFSKNIENLVRGRQKEIAAAKDRRKMTFKFGPECAFVSPPRIGHRSLTATAGAGATPESFTTARSSHPTPSRSRSFQTNSSTLRPSTPQPSSRRPSASSTTLPIPSSPRTFNQHSSIPTTPVRTPSNKREIIDLDSYIPGSKMSESRKRARGSYTPSGTPGSKRVRRDVLVSVVDLTAEGDEVVGSPTPTPTPKAGVRKEEVVLVNLEVDVEDEGEVVEVTKDLEVVEEAEAEAEADAEEGENLLSWEEWIEEDWWWPPGC